MYLAFVDDATQRPTRPGITGRIIAAGAILVPADNVRVLGADLDGICNDYGFPPREEFKWSPRRDTWMHSNLVDAAREGFFFRVIDALIGAESLGLVVLEDDGRNPANRKLNAQQDVIVLLLERIANRLSERGETGLVVADRPGGGRKNEDAFLADCLQTLEVGTDYVQHNEIAFVVTADSQLVRLLQAADLLTSCIAAYVAGESRYSPAVAQRLMDLLPPSLGRRGGYSVKVHPDFCFGNLYHWLFGDEDFWRHGRGSPMPVRSLPYSAGPETP